MIDVLCIIAVVGQLISMASLHIHRKPIYPLIIIVYTLYSIIEAYLASMTSWYVLLFLVVNVWGIVSAILGWRTQYE